MAQLSGYRSHWRGTITDVTRRKPYEGEIVISPDGVKATTYHMAHGLKKGELTPLCTLNGFLVVGEVVGDFRGTMVLYAGADGNLKCVWRGASGFNSEASMTRASPAGETG